MKQASKQAMADADDASQVGGLRSGGLGADAARFDGEAGLHFQ